MHLNLEKIQTFYRELPERLQKIRQKITSPLTLTEKILYAHASEALNDHLELIFDHLAADDATGQLLLLQFALSGKSTPTLPTTIHCDHLITAEKGEKEDIARAYEENGEVFEFLESASAKYGIDFWKPGTGIMHHQLLENESFPGGLLMGTDPQTPFCGAMGMLALEGNSLDALDAMMGLSYGITLPRTIGVRLSGQLKGWASPKDLILKLVPLLIAKKAKGAVIEFFGPGAKTLSCSGKGTVCSMASEVEALSALFPYDESMKEYLHAVGRAEIALLAEQNAEQLCADKEVLNDPLIYFDEVIDVDLSTLEPYMNGPYGLHRTTPLSEFAAAVRHHDYPEKLSVGLIGSCTNSSYQDIKKAALLAKQALKHGLKVKAPLMISPGSEQIRDTLINEGLWKVLEDVGAMFLASSCGPCIGQWKRHDIPFGERNSIVTSYHCNSSGHTDNNPNTQAFIASPEVVIALAFAGTLTFDPQEGVLMTPQGLPLKLVPAQEDLQEQGASDPQAKGFIPCLEEGANVTISLDPSSERLQFLEPFKTLSEKNFSDLRLLVKVGGKCTTDQISPAGKWLRYRAHLDNMSNGLFTLAPNRFREEIGKGKNLLTGSIEPFAKVAREYKKEGIGWIAVAYDHCGEGPCREHAALGIRHLGGQALIANSFAPIFEMQLKKQGVLTLTFVNPADCEKIREDDLIDLFGVGHFAVGSTLELLLKHADGTTERLSLVHSYTSQQITWFRAGSIFNVV